jgi:hypothetical protein
MLFLSFKILVYFFGSLNSFNSITPFQQQNILNAHEILKKSETNRKHLNFMIDFMMNSNTISTILGNFINFNLFPDSLSLYQNFAEKKFEFLYSIQEGILHILNVLLISQVSQKNEKFPLFECLKVLVKRLEWPEELKIVLSKNKWNEVYESYF